MNEKRIDATELLVLYPEAVQNGRAWDELGDDAGVFDDNGGNPDGGSWYAPAWAIENESIAFVKHNRCGYVAQGVEIRPYDGGDEDQEYMAEHFQGRWCGYSSRNVAYGLKPEYDPQDGDKVTWLEKFTGTVTDVGAGCLKINWGTNKASWYAMQEYVNFVRSGHIRPA
jgi:hypothetical protein